MTTQTMAGRGNLFKIGWIGMLVLSALLTLNHLVLAVFMPDEIVLFMGWAAFNIYSTVVLAIPFRQGERWAWYASWVLVIVSALMILFEPNIGAMYLGVGILIAVGLLLTRPAFFR